MRLNEGEQYCFWGLLSLDWILGSPLWMKA